MCWWDILLLLDGEYRLSHSLLLTGQQRECFFLPGRFVQSLFFCHHSDPSTLCDCTDQKVFRKEFNKHLILPMQVLQMVLIK